MKTREVIPLLVKMTPDEQRQRGVDLADARRALDELARAKKSLGKQIETQEGEIEKLTTAVHYCQEERPVEVQYVPDMDADTMTTIRQDTLEIVGVRQLDGNERRELREPLLKLAGKTMDDADDGNPYFGFTYDLGDNRRLGIAQADDGKWIAGYFDEDGLHAIDLAANLPAQDSPEVAQDELDKWAIEKCLPAWLAEAAPGATETATDAEG